MENSLNEGTMPKELVLNNYAKGFLKETAKWANFLAIIGFIGIGFMVLAGFFMGTIMSTLPNMNDMPFNIGPFMTGIYLLMALLYFFPVRYLYRFAVKMKASLASNDDEELAEAFLNLKSHYKFVGILAIIMLAFYALIILFSIAAALMV